MKLTEFEDYDWKTYCNIVDNYTSKNCFISYPIDEFGNYQPKINVERGSYYKLYNVVFKSNIYGIIYIPIHKNAHLSLIKSLELEPIELNSNSIEELKKYKFFTVTRDPKTRWISGMLEYLIHAKKLNIFSESMKELLNNKFIFDGHLIPQLNHLYPTLNFNIDIHLIKLDKKLDYKISEFIGKSITVEHLNNHKNDKFKIKFKNYFLKIFDQYCSKNQEFLELYKKDFYLYELSN